MLIQVYQTIFYFLKTNNDTSLIISELSIFGFAILRLIPIFSIIAFATFGFLIGGGRLVYITLKLQQYSPSLQIPLALVYAIVPLSGLLIIFYKITQKSE
jgi:TRAP-type C4-dicarboxylate transport system permease small subunit